MISQWSVWYVVFLSHGLRLNLANLSWTLQNPVQLAWMLIWHGSVLWWWILGLSGMDIKQRSSDREGHTILLPWWLHFSMQSVRMRRNTWDQHLKFFSLEIWYTKLQMEWNGTRLVHHWLGKLSGILDRNQFMRHVEVIVRFYRSLLSVRVSN